MSRDDSAWWLRIQGHTYVSIADRLRLPSGADAKAAVDRANKRMTGRVDGSRRED